MTSYTYTRIKTNGFAHFQNVKLISSRNVLGSSKKYTAHYTNLNVFNIMFRNGYIYILIRYELLITQVREPAQEAAREIEPEFVPV